VVGVGDGAGDGATEGTGVGLGIALVGVWGGAASAHVVQTKSAMRTTTADARTISPVDLA